MLCRLLSLHILPEHQVSCQLLLVLRRRPVLHLDIQPLDTRVQDTRHLELGAGQEAHGAHIHLGHGPRPLKTCDQGRLRQYRLRELHPLEMVKEEHPAELAMACLLETCLQLALACLLEMP